MYDGFLVHLVFRRLENRSISVFPKLIKKGVRSVVLFSTPGTWDAVIQISYPLAQFQMSFATLLQETQIVPPFLLMYARAVVLSSFTNTCSLVSFFQKAFKQKKPASNSREFLRHFFLYNSIYLKFLSLDLCLPSLQNLHQKKVSDQN